MPKVHTFQKSLEAVMQRLAEAERTQTALSNTTMAKMNSGATATESEILFFRNQLKVSKQGVYFMRKFSVSWHFIKTNVFKVLLS